MAYDPVLDREMFRPKAKSKGLEDLRDSEDPAVIARREQALAMMEAAKQKFDPSNYQTLGEQDRPGVFRPVAVNMPAPQPTVDTATRMQQLANMGMRPIGMAKGGDLANKVSPTITPYGEQPVSQGRVDHWNSLWPEAAIDISNEPYITNDQFDRLKEEKYAADRILGQYGLESDTPTDLLSDEEKAAVEQTRSPKPEGRSRSFADEVRRIKEEEDAKALQEEIDALKGVNPETGRKAPSGDIYPNSDVPYPTDKSGAPIQPSRKTLRPERSWWESFNPGRAVDEWTEKKIEEKAAAAPLPKVIPGGQYVRPEYPRTLTREELAAKRAREEGIPVAAPAASAASAGPVATPEGVATLVGSGRGTAERPGERKAYEDALVAKNRTSGGKPAGAADTMRTASTGAAHPTNLSDIKRDRDDAFNMALMQAGLAMMAGRSSNALTNIGEGGIAGLQAYANQLAQSRARGLEERKLDMMEKYYGSREKALEAAGIRHLDAMNRIKLDAMKAADAAVATELKANPTMAKRDADLLRQQTYDRYMSAIANNAEFTSSAPELNPEATSILGD